MDVINRVSKNLRCQSVQWDAAAWVHRMPRFDTITVHRLFIRPAARNISAAQSPAPLWSSRHKGQAPPDNSRAVCLQNETVCPAFQKTEEGFLCHIFRHMPVTKTKIQVFENPVILIFQIHHMPSFLMYCHKSITKKDLFCAACRKWLFIQITCSLTCSLI